MSDLPAVPQRVSQSSGVPPAMVYLYDKDSEGLVRQCLNGLGVLTPYFGTGGIRGAISELAKRTSPPLLIVDISGIDEPLAALRELSEVCEPGTGVIVVGADNDIILYRAMKDAGIAEYFFKPLVSTVVTRACNAILTGASGKRSVQTGKLVLMLGVRGGSGATTIATRLAWHLSQARKRRVMLIDFNLTAGDASLLLDVKAQHSLRVALEHPERVDDLFLERGVTRVTERLNLFASMEPLDSVIQYGEDAALSLISTLLRNYRYVFVDLQTEQAPALPRFLHLPSICFLISDASLTAARDVARWRALLGPDTSERMTIHILNKSNAPGALPIAEFVRAAGAAPNINVAYDRDAAAAANLGILELEKCHSFFQALAPALQAIAGESVETERTLLSRIFG